MDRKSFESRSFQNVNLHNVWAEYFPRYMRMGLMGTIVVSAVILAHDKLSNRTAEIETTTDLASPNDQAV